MNNNAEDEWFDVTIAHDALSDASVGISTFSGNPCIIDWGDGVIQSNIESHITSYTHTYETSATTFKFKTANGLEDIKSFKAYTLNLVDNLSKFQELSLIRELYIFSKDIVGNTSVLGQYIEDIYFKFALSGDLSLFPSTLIDCVVENSQANITGDLMNLPANIRKFEVRKSNITGDIANLPSNIEVFNLNNNDQNITGNIANLPNSIITFRLYSDNTIQGNIGSVPSTLYELTIGSGNNIISGTLDSMPTNIKIIHILGDNAISGTINSLNPSTKFIVIAGLNTISGDIANLPATALTVSITGNNTISGNIEDCPTQYLTITGNNTISGNLGARSIDKTKQLIYINGNNTIQYTNSKDFSNLISYILVMDPPYSGFIPSQIDQLLIDLAASNVVATIRLYGGARTSASDSAVSIIESRNGEVTLNA